MKQYVWADSRAVFVATDGMSFKCGACSRVGMKNAKGAIPERCSGCGTTFKVVRRLTEDRKHG